MSEYGGVERPIRHIDLIGYFGDESFQIWALAGMGGGRGAAVDPLEC